MEDEFTRDLQQIIVNMAKEFNASGYHIDIDDIEEYTAKVLRQQSARPDEEYNGFTIEQMDQMCHHPIEPGCPVQLRHLTEEEIARIPFIRQTLHLMNALDQKELKLTPKGNLPVKMVATLYELGAHSQQSDFYTNKTEDNIQEVQFLRAVLKAIGLIKVRSGKLSLTAKGKKLIDSDHNELVRTIMLFFFTEYNTGYFDMMGTNEIGNFGRLYSLWLLHHFGAEWRQLKFYSNEYFKAYPSLEYMSPEITKYYKYRIFFRLFYYIGLCEIDHSIGYLVDQDLKQVRKTPILDMMFSFEEPAKI